MRSSSEEKIKWTSIRGTLHGEPVSPPSNLAGSYYWVRLEKYGWEATWRHDKQKYGPAHLVSDALTEEHAIHACEEHYKKYGG